MHLHNCGSALQMDQEIDQNFIAFPKDYSSQLGYFGPKNEAST